MRPRHPLRTEQAQGIRIVAGEILGCYPGLPIHAIPVFPLRLFSQSQMHRHLRSCIVGPGDPAGKRVGLSTYQTTLSVLAKGDLQHVYGVPSKSITWVSSRSETLEVELPEDVKIEPAENAAQIDEQSAEANDMAAPDIGAVKLRTER